MSIEQFLLRLETFILNPILLLLFSVALLYFLWGITVYIWKSDSEDARRKGAQHMLWGIIGMFIMVAAYAIINLIGNTFGI
ncbi:MAG: hypothetical protein OQJ98_01640 [Candidatus Pacebacteria bacterium]|nr:hypothetical protein [Candidatus Paceibacterota bacterium]